MARSQTDNVYRSMMSFDSFTMIYKVFTCQLH